MVTTAVRRVLTTSDEHVIYVETENSVYRLSIIEEAPGWTNWVVSPATIENSCQLMIARSEC